MEQRAKGKRSLANRRSEVQEEPAKGRASGTGAAERTSSGAPRRLATSSALCTAVPTDLQRAQYRAPTRSSRVRGWSGRDGTSERRRGEGGRFLPGPWEKGTEGGVVGVGSQGRRRQLGAYLLPSLASSTACGTEELVVLLQEDCPSWVSTIPPRAPYIAIVATSTTAAEEPVRHRRSATGPARTASMRTLLSPEGAPTSRRYLRSTGPGPRGPAPGLFPPLPAAYSLPSLRLGPAPFTPLATPPSSLQPSPSAADLAPAPTEILEDLSALCRASSQVPARMRGLRQ